MHATQRARTLADVAFPGTGLLRDAALVVGFALLVAVFAQIAVRLPFTTVPLTGQTLAVLLAGGALGARRGAASLGVYALLGTIGLPVFAPTSGALEGQLVHFVLPWAGTASPLWAITSGGYIVGFVAAAYVVGALAERGWDRGWKVSLAMLAGSAAIYLPGLVWLGYLIGSGALNGALGFDLAAVIPGSTTLDKTLVGGLYPFVAGDLIKLFAAANVLPGAWALLGRRGGGAR
jgi:biotin transport system substrate-specific component